MLFNVGRHLAIGNERKIVSSLAQGTPSKTATDLFVLHFIYGTRNQ